MFGSKLSGYFLTILICIWWLVVDEWIFELLKAVNILEKRFDEVLLVFTTKQTILFWSTYFATDLFNRDIKTSQELRNCPNWAKKGFIVEKVYVVKYPNCLHFASCLHCLHIFNVSICIKLWNFCWTHEIWLKLVLNHEMLLKFYGLVGFCLVWFGWFWKALNLQPWLTQSVRRGW